jgi:hypothetical protein
MDALSPTDLTLAKRVEAHFLTAWSAMGEMDFAGWRVRIARGYSDRANSVTPWEPGRLAAAEKMIWAEQFYGARHLPALVRITERYPDREAPRALYRGAGFRPLYHYHYRRHGGRD